MSVAFSHNIFGETKRYIKGREIFFFFGEMEDNIKTYETETPSSQGHALLRYNPSKSKNKRWAIEGGGITKQIQLGGELAPILAKASTQQLAFL